jgi:Transposase DDE domain
MSACTRSAVSMLTDCFAADGIEDTARRTGLVKRASKITGKLFLALVTFGTWSEATTTLAQLAAKITPLDKQVEVAPEALHQRMNKRAIACLQDMICQALAKVPSLAHVCDDGLFTCFTKVYLADRTGFALPDSLHALFPGSGGSATQAGAKIQAVWDDKHSVFAHFALTPWNIPEQKYSAMVVALAHKAALFLLDLGYFKLQAFARIADAGSDFLSRLTHQTTSLDAETELVQPLNLVSWLSTVKSSSTEKAICLGAKERVAARLVAYRLPEPIVNARRRGANKKAKKKGDTPSQAHLALLAWNLLITNVPRTLWKTETVCKVYPLRWPIELSFKAWKSYLHLASIKTQKEAPTFGYLYGRMLLMVLTYALCPQVRATVWLKHKRELSVLKLVRHVQALADRWMHALFQAQFTLRRFLQRACATAERLATKASRKRPTTAQILRESLSQHHETIALAVAVNA